MVAGSYSAAMPLAMWEGLSLAAGTRSSNCSWHRAQRALRSWHWHCCNSMTAERRALCLQSADPHTAPASRVPGKEISTQHCWRARETSLCATRKGLFSKQDR